MKVYTDVTVLDLRGAVERTVAAPSNESARAAGA
jgi:hypothetical protein